MGIASPPSLALESLSTSSKLILATPSMSRGFHQGSNIFSFSDEFHESPQQQHLAQQSRRDKQQQIIRPVQGFFEDSTAASVKYPLQAPMEEEDDDEDDVEVPGIYGAAPPMAVANNILPEMFNFHGFSCQNSQTSAGYHRFQQRPAAGFLGSAADNWPYAGSRQGLVIDNTGGNWGSLEDAAAGAVGKQHGDMNPDSSTAKRHFFMNPQSPRAPQADHQYEHGHQRPSSISAEDDQTDIGGATAVEAAAVAPLHHPDQASHHSQAFLGSGGAAYLFGGGGGGSVMDTQGLSLSLSSSLRRFEIMSKADQEMQGSVREAASGTLFFDSQLHHNEQAEQHDHHELLAAGHRLQIIRHGQQQQQHMLMSYGGGGDGRGPGPGGSSTAGFMNVLRNSKYARAAQELLEEFCSVGRGGQFQYLRSRNRTARAASSSNPNTSSGHVGGGGASTSAAAAGGVSCSSSKDIQPPLSPADRFENQRKKSKLLSILEEVEKRYKNYCEQMQMVVNSFDTMMGLGAANPYTALAQKAMSRHFRCLKDAVGEQLRGTCEVLGEKDGSGSGSGLTKGETPRLRLIDQNLRQHRAFHQMGMMEQEAWRPQRGLPDRSVNVLRAWLFEHFLHPYPSDADKHLLARQTGLSRNQVSNWFINARVRLWKPMVEEMYQQEANEEEEDLQNCKLDEQTANSRTFESVSMQHHYSKTNQHQSHDQTRQQSPESHASPENDPSSAPVPRSQPRQADDAAAAVIFSPALHDGMYGRAAAVLATSSSAQLRFGSAVASARGSGDLSLTLGLRHAGGNAPETGRFGF